jgi:hypothetical protein
MRSLLEIKTSKIHLEYELKRISKNYTSIRPNDEYFTFDLPNGYHVEYLIIAPIQKRYKP